MKDVTEFMWTWLGKKCRDGQCVSLFREYTEVFNKTPTLERLGEDGGASGLFTRYDSDVGPVSRQVFEKIPYTQGDHPVIFPGEVVVFGPSTTNKYGHVGIVLVHEPRLNNLLILEQNGIAAMNGANVVVELRRWTMERVLGFLRFR